MSKRWVLSIGVALLALFVALQLILQSRYLSDKAKSLVESELKEALGQDVEIGKVSLRLVPTAFIVTDISFKAGVPDRPASLRAKEVRIAFSPASFFTETFLIQEIEILSPELLVSAPRPGDPPFEIKTKKKKGAPSAPSIVIRSIAVKSGSLRFKGENVLKEASFSDLDFTIRPNLEMNRFEIELDGKGGAFAIEDFKGEIDRLDGELIVQGEEIVIKRGKISVAQGSLLADGTITLSEDAQLNLSIDLRHRLEAMDLEGFATERAPFLKDNKLAGEIAFIGRVSGQYPDLLIKGAAVFPEISLNGEVGGALTTDLSFENGRLSLRAMQGKLFSGTLEGEVEIAILVPTDTGTDANETPEIRHPLSANLHYADLPLYPLEKILAQSGPGEKTFLKGLFATGDIQVKGDFAPEKAKAEGSITITRDALFSPPLPAEASALQKLFTLFQEGDAQWRWSGTQLSIEKGTLLFPDTRLAVEATWGPQEGLIAETALESDEIAKVAETFHIPLSGYTKVAGALTYLEGQPTFRGNILLERAAFNQVPVKTLSSSIVVQGKRIAFTQGILNGDSNPTKDNKGTLPSDYRFLGDLDLETPAEPHYDFKVKVLSGDPQEIFRYFHLSIPLYTLARGHLSIEGRGADFSVKGPLSVSKGTLYGERFQSGRVDLEINHNEVILENVFLERRDSRLEGKGAIDYHLNYRLALKGRKLRIQETRFLKNSFPELSGQVALTISGKGSFEAPQMSFEGTVTSLRYGALENLDGEIKAEWEKGAVQVSLRFQDPDFSATGEVLLEPDHPFSFQSRFAGFQFDPFFKKYLSGDAAEISLSASGELSGSGKFTQLAQLNLAGTFTELSAGFGDYQLENDGPLSVVAQDGTFVFDKTRFKGNNTSLVFNGSLSLMKRWDLLINGEADLKLITFFTQEITSANGKVILDLAITDQWQSPHVFGQLKLNDGKIRTATLSQNIHIVSLTALFNERQLVLETFEGKLGSGYFRVSGKAALRGFGIETFGVLAQLEDARINLAVDLPATVDGDLFFKKEAKTQTLKGDLRIKKLIYEKKVDLPSLIKDFQKKGRSGVAAEMPLIGRTELNIHLSGDNGVQIANNIAQVPLGVDLLIKGTFDAPQLIGRIDASQGTVVFRNTTFRLLSGSVDFLDPNKIDPTFDLAAKTEVRSEVTKRNYKVDLLMSGTLSQITLSLSSFPSLPKDDILALLATGKTYADLETIRGGAGAEAGDFAVDQFLGGTVNQLTGFVERPVEELTGTRLRVDPYLNGANARTSSGTRLTAERHLLNERVLVIYSTTLDPTEEDLIRMIYEINKNISLVGNRDDTGQIGGDIRFRFEFR